MNFKNSLALRTILFILLLKVCSPAFSQLDLFNNEDRMDLISRAAFHLYSLNDDSLRFYALKAEELMPDHPVVPMMEAMNVLWQNIPVLRDSTFNLFKNKLEETIDRAQAMDEGEQENPEAIFFELGARGLLAEHYANVGLYLKALDQATQAYGLIKKGFKLDDVISDFYFTSGLYNYFRVRYPEKHPIYRPFVWIFRDGDKELGLKQLDKATKEALIVRYEAYVYIAYIYLRYDDRPLLAQDYMKRLMDQFPTNPYIQSKYLESLTPGEYFSQAPREVILSLLNHEKAYYQMVGHTFEGLYLEKNLGQLLEAENHYKDALQLGSEFEHWGEYYKSLAYLGLGRIAHRQHSERKEEYLRKALSLAETEDIEKEAKTLLGE